MNTVHGRKQWLTDTPLRRQANGVNGDVASNGANGDGEEKVEERVAGGDGKVLRTGYAVVDLEERRIDEAKVVKETDCCES